MNFLKRNHDIVRQNDKVMKTSQKHDANLQKNSTLYFQIGLILVLLAVHGLFEMSFAHKPIKPDIYACGPDEEVITYERTYKIFEEKTVIETPKKKKPVIFTKPIISENDDPVIETKGLISEPQASMPIDPGDLEPVIELPEDDDPIHEKAVEQVPIYPGCENAGTNMERRVCMEEKLKKLITKKFNSDMAADLGLSGKQRIDVEFKINKQSEVVEIKTRARHPKLAQEAKRVMHKIPKMRPGIQRDKPVTVIYQLPILFQVNY